MTHQPHILTSKQTLSLLLSNSSSLTRHPYSKLSLSLTCHFCSETRLSSTYWPTKHDFYKYCHYTHQCYLQVVTLVLIKLFRLRIIAKLYFKPYKSLIKPLACVSAHSSANAFPIRWLSEKSSPLPEKTWVKQQKDGWLDAVRKHTLRTSTSASFHWSSIANRSFSIVHDPEEKSRLGLDSSSSFDYQPDGW